MTEITNTTDLWNEDNDAQAPEAGTSENQETVEGSGTEAGSPRAGDTDTTAEETTSTEDTADTSENADNESGNEAPGIEQYLAQHGISGGMITFESEEEGGEPINKHFNDLSEEEKFNVLSSLAEKGAPSIEDKYGLSEEEIGLLNFVRKGESVEDSINELAQQRVAQILALKDSDGADYSTMSDDAVVAKWLKDNNPEASEADLAEELERTKSGKFYNKTAAALREQFIEGQKVESAKAEEARNNEILAEIDEDRRTIATAVSNMKTVAGWELNDDTKNDVLSDLLEVNSDGDSKFMESVFSDPAELFRVAWLAKNAEEKFNAMEKYYKREMANEYQKGKKDAQEGLSSTPISGVGSNANNDGVNSESPAGRTENVKTAEDLWGTDD